MLCSLVFCYICLFRSVVVALWLDYIHHVQTYALLADHNSLYFSASTRNELIFGLIVATPSFWMASCEVNAVPRNHALRSSHWQILGLTQQDDSAIGVVRDVNAPKLRPCCGERGKQ